MTEASLPWGKWRVLGYALLVAAVFLATQVAVTLVVAAFEAASNPGLDMEAWLAASAKNGFVLSIASLATALTCVPLIWFLASRRESAPWSYLGLRPFSRTSLLLWCVAALAFMLCSDLLTLALGKPLVPPFMTDIYASAGSPLLLLLALTVSIPIVEELFFRGFILSALDSLGVPFRFAATASALAWAVIHTQYELYEVVLIFALGLLLAEARYRSRSIIPCIAMHSVFNLGAFVETALTAS
jgi:membrane protease YdiL (CAAX protease family)